MSVLALSRIKAIREWDEGYEELEFMPNGFAVELTDGAPWLFFVDSKEEKVSSFSSFIPQVNDFCFSFIFYRTYFPVSLGKRAVNEPELP